MTSAQSEQHVQDSAVDVPGVEELLNRVHELEPLIRQHSDEAEINRKLSMPVVEAIRDAGFFKLLIPKCYGGAEIDLPSAYRIYEAFSDIDSAVGWAVANSNGPALAGAALNPEAAEEIYGDPNTILAGAAFPPGKAVSEDGGYRINGSISYVSGSDFATWIAGTSFVYKDDGSMETGEDGNPIRLRALFRPEDLEITDNWDTLGMRGTGSHDVLVKDVFVEKKCCHVLGPISNPASAYSGPLYRCGAIAATPFITTVVLASANCALNDAIDLAAKKTPAYMPASIGDRPVSQSLLAEAKGKIDSSRVYLASAIEDLWSNAVSGDPISDESKYALQIAASHGTKAAGEAISLIYQVITSSGVHRAQPFERHMRDIQTLLTHAFTSTARFESAGKMLVGRKTDWAFLY